MARRQHLLAVDRDGRARDRAALEVQHAAGDDVARVGREDVVADAGEDLEPVEALGIVVNRCCFA